MVSGNEFIVCFYSNHLSINVHISVYLCVVLLGCSSNQGSNDAGPSMNDEYYEPDDEEQIENTVNLVQKELKKAYVSRLEDTRLDHTFFHLLYG